MVGIKRVYGELFKELDANRILLNHISAIDNFNYKINFHHNGNPLNDENDISVSLPADVLGAQAFYNIIENIIRNTAKHNNSKTDDVVKFTVNFIDEPLNKEKPFSEEDKYYRVEIWDNVPISGDIKQLKNNVKNDKDIKDDYSKYFDEDMDENMSKIEDAADLLVFNQNSRMNQSVIESHTHLLRTGSLGLIEMEASAAFLRQMDLPEIESDCYTLKHGKHYNTYNSKDYPYFIQAFKKKLSDNKGVSLGYRFYIKRPEKYLIITDEFAEDKKKQLLNNGISIINCEKFKKSLEGDTPTCYNHEFALLVGEDVNNNSESPFKFFFESREAKKKAEVRDRTPELSLLPERLMKVDNEFIKSLAKTELNKEVFEDFEKKVWEQWIGKVTDNNNNPLKRVYANSICGNQKQIILFDHLDDKNSWQTEEENFRKNKIVAVESLSSNAQQKLPCFYLKGDLGLYLLELKNNPQGNANIILKLFEAYSNKLVVLDERIQEFSKDIYKEDIPNFRIFRCSNVIMPLTQEIKNNIEVNNTNEYTFQWKEGEEIPVIHLGQKEYTTELIKQIEDFIEKQIKNADFLLIHYGILERMYENHNQINEKLNKWNVSTRVVVTTGRGKHSLQELPHNISFINLSAVLYAFKENRNKYSINNILNKSRR